MEDLQFKLEEEEITLGDELRVRHLIKQWSLDKFKFAFNIGWMAQFLMHTKILKYAH